tara:strand:- start:933 stop:1133 length:201 start_codon:yes stop_codon:yes gene_type:complete
MKKETRKFIPPYASLTFDEVWLAEDELWDISLKESKKQKQERLERINEKNMSNMQKGISNNKVAKD